MRNYLISGNSIRINNEFIQFALHK